MELVEVPFDERYGTVKRGALVGTIVNKEPALGFLCYETDNPVPVPLKYACGSQQMSEIKKSLAYKNRCSKHKNDLTKGGSSKSAKKKVKAAKRKISAAADV